jgi:hypothetical protein
MVLAGVTARAPAGIIFGKKPKPPPEKRVPELITILRTDGDESKRSEAAEELRQYDAGQFKEILPTLIEALMTDKKASVRVEAAQSLGKIRPPSKEMGKDVGAALEFARDNDASMRVRMQARSSLLNQHWFGQRTSPGDLKPDKPPPSTKEPPLAPPVPHVAPTASQSLKPPPPAPIPAPATMPPLVPLPTSPPPNARPAPLPPRIETPPIPMPLPPVSTNPNAPQPLPKGPPSEEKGPSLEPQL